MIDRALLLAAQARYLCPPNPAVGCVITDPQGKVLGEGFTQRAGSSHAEVMALHDMASKGHSAHGATAYVTLEPCSHHGRTGPCCEALIEAGISRVVASITDPNPKVAGQGFARLRAAGIAVEVGPGAVASRELNIGFFSRMERNTPWVRLKVASSLDGRTALANGVSQWITSPESRKDGHTWRARASAILTGIGTVLADNPQLDVRLVETERQPDLAIIDNRLETPPAARLFDIKRRVLIYTATNDKDRIATLSGRGATVIHCPSQTAVAAGKVDLRAMLRDLAIREVNELHVEAGPRLNGALLSHGLVDEFLVYLAPRLLGPGLGLADLPSLTDLSQAFNLEFQSVERTGTDIRVLARFAGRDINADTSAHQAP